MNKYAEYVVAGIMMLELGYIAYKMRCVKDINEDNQRNTRNINNLANTVTEFKQAFRDRARKEDNTKGKEIDMKGRREESVL